MALTWLHNALDGRSFKLLPILCGSFQKFIVDKQQPDKDETIGNVIEALTEYRKKSRTLVIAAGDLAHMGPEFGDATPMDELSLADLASKDHISLANIEKGAPDEFFNTSAEADQQNTSVVSIAGTLLFGD